MRPIIFRAKRKDNGEWVEGSLIIAKNFCCILQDEEKVHPLDYPYLGNESGCIDGYATPVIPETVGQYTGLLDKHGKKIFEGDIVKIHWKYVNAGCEEDCFYMVEWHKSWNGWSLTNIKAIQSCYLYQARDGEVIGNVIDNPELLEVENDKQICD